MRTILANLGLLAALACAPRPKIPTEGLGRDCQANVDCAEGQSCHAWAHPECTDQQCRTCEIVCDDDSDCPQGLRCNRPPALPDTAVDTCVDAR